MLKIALLSCLLVLASCGGGDAKDPPSTTQHPAFVPAQLPATPAISAVHP